MKITGFTGWLVEAEPGPKYIWRNGIPGSHSDIPRGSKPRTLRECQHPCLPPSSVYAPDLPIWA